MTPIPDLPVAYLKQSCVPFWKGVAGHTGRQVTDAVCVLDSTTIGLFAKTHSMLRYRSNNSAIKLHLLFDPDAESPAWFQITPARFHDSKVCDQLDLQAGTTYVLDRAYNNAHFWVDIEAAGAFFLTRPKTNLAYDVEASRHHPGTLIVSHKTIRLARSPGKAYCRQLRRVEVFDMERGEEIAFIANNFDRPAEQIANLYKRRWQIELFFKWLKQNLKLNRLLARNPKAIRLQIITALIAYALLHQFHLRNRLTIPLKRLAASTRNYAFNLSAINHIIRPPDKNKHNKPQNQLAMYFPGQEPTLV